MLDYLNLLKIMLTDSHRPIEYKPVGRTSFKPLNAILKKLGYCVCKKVHTDRWMGKDIPTYAETMIGVLRLDNIQGCIERIITDEVEGDLIECGVWRGGAAIFMQAMLMKYKAFDRKLWLADSFKGLPRPSCAEDSGDVHYKMGELAVSLGGVASNFNKYDLLRGNVQFLKGWFKDTLPTAPIEKLALIRLDGDMYESTMDGLLHLYDKLSPGGYIIIDDYGAVPGCKLAVDNFRRINQVKEEIEWIDWTGIYWRKGWL